MKSLCVSAGEGGREVIIVDPSSDAGLAGCVEDAKTAVSGTAERSTARAEALAGFVSGRLGGAGGRDIVSRCESHLADLRRGTGSGGIPLGSIRVGVCRHRSILFKYLSDQPGIDLPCRLVRGIVDFGGQGGGGHAWNVVRVSGSGSDDAGEDHYVMDVMNYSLLDAGSFGALLRVGSAAAVTYERTGGGSMGGPSVLGHDPDAFGPGDLDDFGNFRDRLGMGGFG